MTTPWLVLIESNTSGTGRLFARAASQQGVRPILMTDDPARYSYAEQERLEVLRTNTGEEAALLDACQRLSSGAGVAGITSSSEYFISMAATLARKLGLPGAPPEVVATCRDKQAQRTRLRQAGVGIPAFRPASSVGQAVRAAEELGFPVVVKPVSGTGSVGVKLCADGDGVALHADALLKQERNERGMAIPQRILVEELATGPEYSVETFGTQLIGITQKHIGRHPHFVEVGHDYPADLTPADEELIRREVRRAAAALGLAWGPAHFELRLTTGGPKIIEVNPRLAGGYIPELVRLATGIDLVAETIRGTLGLEPQLTKRAQRHASIRFILSPRDGLLTEWKGLEQARRVAGVEDVQSYAEPGAELRLRGDFRDRIGHIIATGATSASARATVQLAEHLVQAIVGPPAGPAAERF
jgi:biotin carboxylase